MRVGADHGEGQLTKCGGGVKSLRVFISFSCEGKEIWRDTELYRCIAKRYMNTYMDSHLDIKIWRCIDKQI